MIINKFKAFAPKDFADYIQRVSSSIVSIEVAKLAITEYTRLYNLVADLEGNFVTLRTNYLQIKGLYDRKDIELKKYKTELEEAEADIKKYKEEIERLKALGSAPEATPHRRVKDINMYGFSNYVLPEVRLMLKSYCRLNRIRMCDTFTNDLCKATFKAFTDSIDLTQVNGDLRNDVITKYGCRQFKNYKQIMYSEKIIEGFYKFLLTRYETGKK